MLAHFHRFAIAVAALGVAACAAAGTRAPAAGKDAQKVQPIYAEYTSAGGAADVREVRLLVDGRDVTAESAITPLRVTYAPKDALAPGIHAAQVVVTDSMGRSWRKDWQFTIEAATKPAFERVWSEELLIELDRPPRQVQRPVLALAGWTQPGAEVVVRMDGGEAARVQASNTGRFRASITLQVGDNALTLAAHRLDATDAKSADEGPEVSVRVERVDTSDDDEDVVTRPPSGRRLPVPRTAPPRSVFASARPPVLDPATEIPTMPEAPPEVPKDPPVIVATRTEPGAKAPVVSDDTARAPEITIPTRPDPPDPPGDDAEVVITKPVDGDVLRPGHATVLGRAPAGWRVSLLVDGSFAAGAEDVANPAGRFTMPDVDMGAGRHELIAEADSGERTLRSKPVVVQMEAERFRLDSAGAIAMLTPERASGIARGGVQRVSGTAWDGAEVEVEVNGRVVAREIAGMGGRFDVDVPLENGLNVLLVEAASMDGSQVARSKEYAISASGAARAGVESPVRQARLGEPVLRAPVRGRSGSAPAPGAAMP